MRTLVATPSLRYWRTRRLMRRELAERIGVAHSTIQRLQAGGSVRLTTVAKLAETLRIEPALMRQPPADT